MPLLWKTRRVADALGMSVSTVKRLVDTGQIQAARSAGRHRLIPLNEAIRFARERSLPMEALQAALSATLPVFSEFGRVEPASAESLVDLLRQGRAQEAARHMVAAYHNAGAAAFGDDLIGPAMRAIGQHWQSGSIDIYQEHQATRIVESVLLDLISNARSAARRDDARPVAIGAAIEGDPYTLSGLLCELLLVEKGWDASYLGANLPLASLAAAVSDRNPRLVWLTVNYLQDSARFCSDFEALSQVATQRGVAIVIGGHAMQPELRARLKSTLCADRIAHLAELALHIDKARPVSAHLGPQPD